MAVAGAAMQARATSAVKVCFMVILLARRAIVGQRVNVPLLSARIGQDVGDVHHLAANNAGNGIVWMLRATP
jgi:hypothetical protein